MKKFKTFMYNPNASFMFQKKDAQDSVQRWMEGKSRRAGDSILLTFTGSDDYPVSIHIGFNFEDTQ
jgi:hypothetical protein